MRESDFTARAVAMGVLVTAVLVTAISVVVSPRVGVVALGLFALAGAGARAVSPLRHAFVVRHKAVDVLVLLAFSGALIYLGLTTELG